MRWMAAVAIAVLASCGDMGVRPPPGVDAGVDAEACALVFGVCHSDLDGACYIARYRTTSELAQRECFVSFAVCEPRRDDAMRAAGCAPE